MSNAGGRFVDKLTDFVLERGGRPYVMSAASAWVALVLLFQSRAMVEDKWEYFTEIPLVLLFIGSICRIAWISWMSRETY